MPAPEISVQVRTQSANGALSLDELAARNQTVLSEFNAAERAAVNDVDSHFYYYEGRNPGAPNFHSYANLTNAVDCSLAIMQSWSNALGRTVDFNFSEWNVNLNDANNTGLMQLPVLLEMFTAMISGGVDQLSFWSAMYNATSLANATGQLQAAGTLMSIMSRDLIGMKATEIPVASTDYDIHGFAGRGKAELFASSLSDQTQTLNLDLSRYLERHDLTSARLLQADATKADGTFRDLTGLKPWQEPDVPVLVNGAPITVDPVTGIYQTTLGPHETLILQMKVVAVTYGTSGNDQLSGTANADRIAGRQGNDILSGLAGDDLLYGGLGNDTIRGCHGADRIWGGLGRDLLLGGLGNDTIQGMGNSDVIHGKAGNDYLSGGNGNDTIWGETGADRFVFRQGEWGADRIMDYSDLQGDRLVFEGAHVTRDSFEVSIRPLAGFGGETTADVVIRLGSAGPLIWLLRDGAELPHLVVEDAATGTLISLF